MAVSSKKSKRTKKIAFYVTMVAFFMYHVVPICDYVNDFI